MSKVTTPKKPPNSKPAKKAGKLFEVHSLKVEDIYPDPDQPRANMTGIEELAASIATFGQLHPIAVRKVGNTYRIIGGERRWTAHKALEAETIYAYIADSDEAEDVLLELVDNMHVPLTDEERSRGAQRAFTFDAPIERIAAAVGRPVESVERAKRGYEMVNDPTAAEEWTLDDLAMLVEFEDDAEAVASILKAGLDRARVVAALRYARKDAEKRAGLAAIVEAAGVPLLVDLDHSEYRVLFRGDAMPEGATAAYISPHYAEIQWLAPNTGEVSPEAAAEAEAREKARQERAEADAARLAHMVRTVDMNASFRKLAEAAWEGTGAFDGHSYAARVEILHDDGILAGLSGFPVRSAAAVLASVDRNVGSVIYGYDGGLGDGYYVKLQGRGILAYLDELIATGYEPSETEAAHIALLREAVGKQAKAAKKAAKAAAKGEQSCEACAVKLAGDCEGDDDFTADDPCPDFEAVAS